MKPLKWVRVAVAAATLTGSISAVGVIASTVANASYGNVVATTAVNIRSGPSTSNRVLGVLYPGFSVAQTGPVKDGWVQVNYNGSTAYIAAQYLRGVSKESSPETPAGATTGQAGQLYTTAALNVRTGPSTAYSKVGLLSKGTLVTTTGREARRFTEITYHGTKRWVSSDYLTKTAPAPSSPATPKKPSGLEAKIKYQARATAALNIRDSSKARYNTITEVPRGTILQMTGVEENDVAQIVFRGELRWVNRHYIVRINDSAGATAPKLPAVIGTRYATTALDIRTSSGSDSRTVGEVPRGTALEVTGVVKNGRAQIVYQGTVRWVTAKYLSATKPSESLNTGGSVGLDELKGMGKEIVKNTRKLWPQITTMYGYSPHRAPDGDHARGLAVDLMLPNYKKNKALGWEIAKYYRTHAKKFRIQYIIFEQQIWNIQRDREGWRKMADRGSDTQNHIDHIHITFYP